MSEKIHHAGFPGYIDYMIEHIHWTVETRAQHALLHTGLELHPVTPSLDGSEKKI